MGSDPEPPVSCPRQCGVDVGDHVSSDLIDGHCDIEQAYRIEPVTDWAGYLPCGCHGSQRDHTCIPFN